MHTVWNDYEAAQVKQMLSASFIGSMETVKEGIQRFVKRTGIDELMAAAHIYDPAAKLHSYKLLRDAISS